MYVKRFQITNFKSYSDSGTLDLSPGFNIVTGQNNVGKTSLLEALALDFSQVPHRSLRTVPAPGSAVNPKATARVTFVAMQDEVRRMIRGGQHFVSAPTQDFQIPGDGRYDGSPQTARAFAEWLFGENHQFEIQFTLSKSVDGAEVWDAEEPILNGLYPASALFEGTSRRNFLTISVDFDGAVRHMNFSAQDKNDDFALGLAKRFRSQLYRFSAERFNTGECPVGTNSILQNNAGSLPEVLDVLLGNPVKFQELIGLVREVLPQVQNVSLLPQSNNRKQIKIWTHGRDIREDLAVPLSQSGSGIGQVLAILYVAISAHHPQTIIVDEPQSFLHPGAIRKLIEVLKRYPQHQYIIATHSPTVITASNPETLIILRQNASETSCGEINARDRKQLQSYLMEIGAKLSDVFGADNVLWVEGQTEELCFPRILKEVANRSLMGTAIVGIRQTGDLEGHDAQRIFAMYRRITAGNSLLPPAIAFVLDRECHNGQQIREISAMSGNLATFLDRRMYENYLLDASSIAYVMNSIEGFRDDAVTREEIDELMQRKRQELKYYCRGTAEVPNNWLQHIHGAELLGDMFAGLSQDRVAFVKTIHSVAITEHILTHNPENLREISDLLVGLLDV